ncbi:Ribosome biogenesis ATPase rix7 [Ceratocystis pirilliformis]|uniref:Ribosome biogenesis ATPase rix7 n=1 Tax=Ceratocystis pirilliformis TaxID=259994 RepID=A0ABR3YWF2_9PEZI
MVSFVKQRPRSHLRQGIDDSVYQIVRKLEDERAEGKRNPPRRLTIGEIYDSIKSSNSALARQKRRPLEDSIERVIRFRKEEETIVDDEEDEIRLAEEAAAQEDAASMLNNQVVSGWSTSKATPSVIAMNDSPDRPKKRRRTVSPRPTVPSASASQITPAKLTVSAADAPAKKKLRAGRGYETLTQLDVPALGGVDDLIAHLEKYVFPDMLKREGRSLNRGLLLSGPVGCGKKETIKYLASRWQVPLLQIKNSTLLNVDKAEKVLAEVVDEAKRLAPCVVLFPSFHDLFGSSGAGSSDRLMKVLISEALIQLSDAQIPERPIAVVATTNSAESIPKDLLLSRRLAETHKMKVPDVKTREQILEALSLGMDLPQLNWTDIARRTHGYVAEDLYNLLTKSMVESHRLARDEAVVLDDVVNSMVSYTPQLLRQGFSTIPSIDFAQVGGLGRVRKELYANIIRPITHPEIYARFGITKPSGVLLWGPPGCGKTLVAQAVANAAQASFVLIKGPELLDKYVGESERKIRELFTRARSCAPCLLFFDEMDSLVPRRENTSTEAGARVVNTFLAELDGGQDRTGVYVIATTNRPDMIDSAMLRPGRLDTRLFVDLPDEEERVDILRTLFCTRTTYEHNEADLQLIERIARDPKCANFSGADLQQLHKHAVQYCLERVMELEANTTGEVDMRLTEKDWKAALVKTTATVTDSAHLDYLKLAAEM